MRSDTLKKGGAIFSAVWLLAACVALDLKAHADNELLYQTHLSGLPLVEGSPVMVHRKFDSEGRLLELRYEQQNDETAPVETLSIEPETAGKGETRRREIKRQGKLLRLEVERYLRDGRLVESEAKWPALPGGPLDRREVTTFQNRKKIVRSYKLRTGS